MLRDLKLGTKLTGGFTAVALLCVVVGAFGWYSLARVDGIAKQVTDDHVPALVALNQVQRGLTDMRRLDLAMLLYSGAGDRSTLAVRRAQFDSAVAMAAAGVAAYERLPRDADEDAHWQRARAAIESTRSFYGGYVGVLDAGDFARAQQLSLSEGYKAFNTATAAVTEAVGLQQKNATESGEAIARAYRFGRWFLLVGALLALALGLTLGLTLTRSIVFRIRAVVRRSEELRDRVLAGIGRASEAMRDGNLDVKVEIDARPIPVDSRDELGELVTLLNGMLEEAQRTATAFTDAARALRHVSADRMQIIDAVRRGELAQRGQAAGAFGAMIEQMNGMMAGLEAPVAEAVTVLERLAARDLTARMHGDYRGHFARMKEAMNSAAEQLEDALADVRSSAEQVALASDHIGDGSQQLAEGASEQASSLEEISSSLQELSSMARQNAANAREALSLGEEARTGAAAGQERVRQLATAVDGIKESSAATARIVKTIDEIAFQTNLLALNAAVEAARAGDAGKGFAVVAEEVRNLAQRSAEAARNTAELIEQAVRASEGGAESTVGVLRDIQEILARIGKVSDVLGEITAASEQQSDGVTEISKAVEQMNVVTQQVASHSEESASAAEELRTQAGGLRDLAASFELAASGTVRSAPVADGGAPAIAGTPRKAVTAPKARTGGDGHNGNGRKSRKNGKNGSKNGGNGSSSAAVARDLIPFEDDDLSALGEF